MRSFSDALPTDSARESYLRSLIPKMVNTRGSRWVEARRVALVVDHMVRWLLPMLLSSRGCSVEARELASLRPIRTHTALQMAGLAAEEECGHREVALAAKMAASAEDPELWVPTVGSLIGEIGTPAAYDVGITLIKRLIDAQGVVNERGSDQKTLPPIA